MPRELMHVTMQCLTFHQLGVMNVNRELGLAVHLAKTMHSAKDRQIEASNGHKRMGEI